MNKINQLNEYIITNTNVSQSIKNFEKMLSNKEQINELIRKKKNLEKENNTINELVIMDIQNKENLLNNEKIKIIIKKMEIEYKKLSDEYNKKILNYNILKKNIIIRTNIENQIEKLSNIKIKYMIVMIYPSLYFSKRLKTVKNL